MKQTGHQQIFGLDFIRFAAALLVLCYHLGYKAFATPGNVLLTLTHRPVTVPSWALATCWGWIGVQIFFVISGMVISYSTDNVTAGQFGRRRVLRLVPTAWVCATVALLVSIGLFGAGLKPSLLPYLRVMAFAPSGPWLLGQFWTLPIEYCFYAIVGGLIAVRLGRHLEPLAWALALISAAYFLATHVAHLHDPNGRVSALLMLQHGGYFALGIILTRGDLDGWKPRHAVLIAVTVIIAAVQIHDAAVGERLADTLTPQWPIALAIWLVGVGAIAASLHWKEAIARRLARHGAFIRLIGLLTYPLYLIHEHTGGAVLVIGLRHGWNPWLAIGSGLVVSLVAAWAVVQLIEPPVRQALDRLVFRQPAASR
jgi:exopolysaccharide production protein ExoZ